MNEITKSNVKYLEETKELYRTLSEGFLSLGEHLYKIFTEELWRGKYDLYDEFLDDIGISPSNASKIRQVYEHYVLRIGYSDREKLSKVPWSTLYTGIKLVNTKTEVDDLMLKRRQDIEEIARIAKRGDCERHSWCTIRFCTKCQKREKVL